MFNFLNFLRKKKKQNQLSKIGIEKELAICPYCNKQLEKSPSRKKACPYCNKYIFVRTRPIDRKSVLVTSEQVDVIEMEWHIVNGTIDEYREKKRECDQIRKKLRKKFGKEPSEYDIQWYIFNKQLFEHAKNNDWGLYRNTRFNMGELLRKEKNLKDALCTYLEVCYIDLNSPNNLGGLGEYWDPIRYPPFNPNKFANLAPGVLERINRIIKKEKFSKHEVYDIYFQHNRKIKAHLKLPVTVEESWDVVQKEIVFDDERKKIKKKS